MSADFIQGIAQKATESTIQSAGSLPSPFTAMPGPSDTDVAQFQQAMQIGDPSSVQTPATDASLTTAPAVDTSLPPNSGDAILGGLQKMTANYNATASSLQQSIEAASANPGDMATMFKLQYQISTLTLQQDLTAKVADRANQGVQTFFKNQ